MIASEAPKHPANARQLTTDGKQLSGECLDSDAHATDSPCDSFQNDDLIPKTEGLPEPGVLSLKPREFNRFRESSLRRLADRLERLGELDSGS